MSDDEDYKPPSYRKVGELLFEITDIDRQPDPMAPRYSAELHEYNGCAFWINEGEGIDYWLDYNIDLDEPGWYKVTGLVGTYHRGEWGYTDDDVTWEFDRCIRVEAESSL